MKCKRSDKVAESIHETVSALLIRGLNDPRIGFVTITSVDVTDDLHYAKIFFSVIGDEASKKATLAGLNSARGFIKREVGKALTMRYIPDISFVYDHTQEYGAKIDNILKEIEHENAAT